MLPPAPAALKRVIVEHETIALRPLKPTEATQVWNDLLGEEPYSDLHPIVSADGARSIRMGPHEMNSSPTRFHFHEETWTFDAATNTWTIDNLVVRVPLK